MRECSCLVKLIESFLFPCDISDSFVCVLYQKCVWRAQRRALAGRCCPAGTLSVRRAAARSLSMEAVEETAIILSLRSIVCLSAAACVSPRHVCETKSAYNHLTYQLTLFTSVTRTPHLIADE